MREKKRKKVCIFFFVFKRKDKKTFIVDTYSSKVEIECAWNGGLCILLCSNCVAWGKILCVWFSDGKNGFFSGKTHNGNETISFPQEM